MGFDSKMVDVGLAKESREDDCPEQLHDSSDIVLRRERLAMPAHVADVMQIIFGRKLNGYFGHALLDVSVYCHDAIPEIPICPAKLRNNFVATVVATPKFRN